MNLASHISKTIESIKLIQDNYNSVTTGLIITFTDGTNMKISAEVGRIDCETKKFLNIK